jgi:hypothetical protein
VCFKLGNVSKEVRAQPTKTCILIRLWAQHTSHCEQLSLPSLVSLSTTKSSFSATRILQATIMDQGGSFGGFKIDKLTASNYHTWKQKIELVLAFRELDEVVFNVESTNILQDAAAIAEFRKKDAKAKAVIGLTLSDEHLEHVRGAKSAAEMWLAIKNVFQRTSSLNKLAARRRFYTVAMLDGERILTYINRVKQLTEELKAMRVTIDEEEVAMAVLNGLPPKYDHLIVALDTMGDDQASPNMERSIYFHI